MATENNTKHPEPIDFEDKDLKFEDKERRFLKTVPYALRERGIFCGWKLFWSEDRKKWTKVPINLKTGAKAKSNDRTTWCDFATAVKNFDKYEVDGLGIFLGNGIAGIDIDHIIENGKISDTARDIINTMDTYTEYSPSNTGFHMLVFSDKIDSETKRLGDLEIYQELRFFTLSGNVFEGRIKMPKKVEGTERLSSVINKYFGENNERIRLATLEATNSTFGDFTSQENKFGLSDDDILSKLAAQEERAVKQNPEAKTPFSDLYIHANWQSYERDHKNPNKDGCNEADYALAQLFCFYTTSPLQVERLMEGSALRRAKWSQRNNGTTYLRNTIMSAFAKQRSQYNPKLNKNLSSSAHSGTVNVLEKDIPEGVMGKVIKFLRLQAFTDQKESKASEDGKKAARTAVVALEKQIRQVKPEELPAFLKFQLNLIKASSEVVNSRFRDKLTAEGAGDSFNSYLLELGNMGKYNLLLTQHLPELLPSTSVATPTFNKNVFIGQSAKRIETLSKDVKVFASFESISNSLRNKLSNVDGNSNKNANQPDM